MNAREPSLPNSRRPSIVKDVDVEALDCRRNEQGNTLRQTLDPTAICLWRLVVHRVQEDIQVCGRHGRRRGQLGTSSCELTGHLATARLPATRPDGRAPGGFCDNASQDPGLSISAVLSELGNPRNCPRSTTNAHHISRNCVQCALSRRAWKVAQQGTSARIHYRVGAFVECVRHTVLQLVAYADRSRGACRAEFAEISLISPRLFVAGRIWAQNRLADGVLFAQRNLGACCTTMELLAFEAPFTMIVHEGSTLVEGRIPGAVILVDLFRG